MKFTDLPSGKSVKGNDIVAFKTAGTFANYTYILGGVHGDEVEGVHMAQKLCEWLSQKDEISTPIVAIPILNVDGHKSFSRVNANGVDLNRNLPSSKWSPDAKEPKYFPGKTPLSEPENQFLVELFKQYPPRFILSFHSWYPVINYNGACREIAEFLARHNSYPIEADFMDHPTPGSLGEYAPQIFGAPVLTFECPVLSETVTLESVWKDNEEAFKKLFTTKIIETFTF